MIDFLLAPPIIFTEVIDGYIVQATAYDAWIIDLSTNQKLDWDIFMICGGDFKKGMKLQEGINCSKPESNKGDFIID